MTNGFTKGYRSKWEHPVFRNLLEAGIWAWMCDTAAWKDTKVRYGESFLEIKRGQLVTSIRFIAKGFCIGEQVTRTFLQNLEKEGMVNTQPTHKGTIITICNYNKYQSTENETNTEGNTQPTHSQHTANTNKKEYKNLKKDIYPENFQKFFDLFPKQRKGSQKNIFTAWQKAITRATEEELQHGLEAYLRSSAVSDGFARGAAAWLNDDGWLFDYSIKPKASNQNKKPKESRQGAIQL